MQVASNKSLTYINPSNWWVSPFKWMCKSQSLNHKEQYVQYGVRLFDVSVSDGDNGKMVVRNGAYVYKHSSLFEIFDFLNQMGDVMVRITFEVSIEEFMSDSYKTKEGKFVEFCKMIEAIYPGIMLFGGNRSFDNKNVFTFGYERNEGAPMVINAEDVSVMYKVFTKYLPFTSVWLNRRMIEKMKVGKGGYLLLNHVEMR